MCRDLAEYGGEFHMNRPPRDQPEDHEIKPVMDLDYPAHDHRWKCGTCQRPIWWDGVFEGRWFHEGEPNLHAPQLGESLTLIYLA